MAQTAFFDKTRTLLEMIKFSHTVFAFPFALMGATLAAMKTGAPPSVGQIFWICVAMVGARSGAMGLNRIIDARIDAENPRTASRHIPAGKVSTREAWLFVLSSFAVLLVAAWMLNPLCFYLSPLALFFLALYSFCKRFTALAHVVLGVCLGAAPVGAWIALRGDVSWQVVALGLAVLFWVAGFDVFYALQDLEFDREKGLHSIPVRLGIERSLCWCAAFTARWSFCCCCSSRSATGLGWIYLLGVAVVAALLVYEHRLVKPGDLSRLDAAFFNMNGYVSVAIFLFTLARALLKYAEDVGVLRREAGSSQSSHQSSHQSGFSDETDRGGDYRRVRFDLRPAPGRGAAEAGLPGDPAPLPRRGWRCCATRPASGGRGRPASACS